MGCSASSAMGLWCARRLTIRRVLVVSTTLSLIGIAYFFVSQRHSHWGAVVGFKHIEGQVEKLRISTIRQAEGNFDLHMKQELARRRENLLRECRRLKPSIIPSDRNYTELYSRVVVSDKHKLLFNFIPKVSCSLWKDLLQLDIRTPQNETLTKRLGMVRADKIPWYLQHYKKAVFVREPITRLLSAWMSKLSGIKRPDLQKTWEGFFKREFMSLVRGTRDKTAASSAKWLNITFAELAQFVVALGPNDTMDVFRDHWLPQSRVSHACHMQYDYIGHFENLAVEGPYLFKWLEAGNEPKFPAPQPSGASEAYQQYTKQLPISLIHKLFNLYRNDYDIFGYSMNDTLNKITGRRV